ncbi:hypothetical protein ACA040_004353 [Xenophilus aerolatus]
MRRHGPQVLSIEGAPHGLRDRGHLFAFSHGASVVQRPTPDRYHSGQRNSLHAAMSVEISQLMSSLGTVGAIARALIDERDRQKAATLQADLTKQVLDTQMQLSQVLAATIDKDAALHALGQRVRELEAAQAEKARYRLAKIGAVGSVFAYELRPQAELVERPDEPHHFLCQTCFDAGKKSVLHVVGGVARCGLCSFAYRLERATPAPPSSRLVSVPDFNRRDW